MKEEEIFQRIERIEKAIRFLAQNHQKYIDKRGSNGAPDTTQEYVDNFWISKVNEILK